MKIRVTACDNELLILAFNGNNSYGLADLKTGYNNRVDVNIDVVNGTYESAIELNGTGKPIEGNYSIGIPAGTYWLALIGMNWGGPTDFKVEVDGKVIPYQAGQNQFGVVWTPEPLKFEN